MAPPPFLKNLSDRQLAATNSHWKLPPCHKPIEALEHFLNSQQLEPRHTQYSWSTLERWQRRQLCWLCCQQSPPSFCFTFDVAIHRLLHCTFYWNVKCWFVMIVDYFFHFFFILICIFIVNLLSDRTINCKMRTLFCSVKVWQSLWASPWHRIRKIIVLLGMHGIIVQKIDTALCVL